MGTYHSSKVCWALLKKKEQTYIHLWTPVLPMDTPMLAYQQKLSIALLQTLDAI